MNEQIFNQIYEGYVKYIKKEGFMTRCSKAEFKLMTFYLFNAIIVLMGEE